jgi:hypothetical protein
MEILCQVVSLIFMTCVVVMSVANKFNTDISQLGTIGLTITFTMKIADTVTGLVTDISRL